MPDPTQEARAEVLSEYREIRKTERPYRAMDEVAGQRAYLVACDAESGEIVPEHVAAFTAARGYCNEIFKRKERQAVRRSAPGSDVFWHHGRIGGDV